MSDEERRDQFAALLAAIDEFAAKCERLKLPEGGLTVITDGLTISIERLAQ
jgi:hypothetical protein